MKMKTRHFFFGMLFSTYAFADGIYPSMTSQDQPWSVTASFGNSKYQYLTPNNKTRAVGRIALANELLLAGDYALGLEFGLQNGHNITMNIPKETLTVLSWIPVHTTLGPMLDLLITAKSDPIGDSLIFAQIKGGLAYRYWEIHNFPAKDVSRLSGEFQAGIGYPISALANLSLLYQGILSGRPQYQFIAGNTISHVSNIPPLHALLLGLSVNL